MTIIDHRKNTRRKMRVPVFIWESEEEKRKGKGTEVTTKDLSASGIAFYAQKIYPIDTRISVEIYLPSRKSPLSTTLRIVSLEVSSHQTDEYVVGGMFVDLQPEERLFIASCVERMDLYGLLDSVLKANASDLHLTVGRPPIARCEGRILPMGAHTIEGGQVEAMIYPLLTRERIRYFEEKRELDFAFSPDTQSRFRVNLHWQKGFVEAALRSIPTTTRSFTELGLPEKIMEQFCHQKSGLVLIAGITGAGKTTTMSAMVAFINKTQEQVIITIEDPIEYTFISERSIVKQRELGSDTLSYAEALKRAMHQDPDVVCVGELLDGDCLLAALKAAETGHLVISTVHAPRAITAIERAVNFLPVEHADHIRQQISSCLVGILYQTLLPGQHGSRVLATEVLINNNATRHLIREGHFSQMQTVLQTGRIQGMYTLEHNLQILVDSGAIDEEVAAAVLKQNYHAE